jgi:hypothetical protein
MTTATRPKFSPAQAPTAELIEVTPTLARAWLSQNSTNRSLRKQLIRTYANEMLAGRWRITGEAIQFGTDGRLLNGQHRLNAVIMADTPVTLLVVSGVDPGAQLVMDSGAKRTASDALGLIGVPNSAITAATARIALSVAYSPDALGSYNASHSEIAEWVDEHPQVHAAATFASTNSKRIACQPSLISYCYMVTAGLDPFAANSFWTAVAEQVAAYPGDPAVALARRLNVARREREKLPKAALLSMIYRAWNSRRDGRPMSIVKVNSPAGGLIPVPVPR